MTDKDRVFMRKALALAEKGAGFTSPNPMVGAVLVKENRVIGEGYHEAFGGPHAEVNAIDRATEDPGGAVMYVTLEPCSHTGKTPPCTEKIVSAGISRVVTAMRDPNPDVAGGGNAALRRRGIAVAEGICQGEAERLNEAFIKFVKTRRPFVTVKCALTLDGWLATGTGDSKWISNEDSREYVHFLRHASDAILVGRGTVAADNPRLTTRLKNGVNGRKGRDPLRVILDKDISTAEDAVVLNEAGAAGTVLVIRDRGLAEKGRNKKARLAEKGVRFIALPLEGGRIDLGRLVDRLGQMNVMSLLIEGGSRVIRSAFDENIIDKVIIFYGPKIFGGNDGVPMVAGTGPKKMADGIRLRHIDVRRFGDDIMVTGYPIV